MSAKPTIFRPSFVPFESKATDFVVILALSFVAGGCLSQEVVHCPIEQAELAKQVLTIAPIGTPRDEAVKRLNAAGIRGSFGAKNVGPDYYCCQAWRRPDGQIWRISLMLHFDKSGKLKEALELPDLFPDRPKTRKT